MRLLIEGAAWLEEKRTACYRSVVFAPEQFKIFRILLVKLNLTPTASTRSDKRHLTLNDAEPTTPKTTKYRRLQNKQVNSDHLEETEILNSIEAKYTGKILYDGALIYKISMKYTPNHYKKLYNLNRFSL